MLRALLLMITMMMMMMRKGVSAASVKIRVARTFSNDFGCGSFCSFVLKELLTIINSRRRPQLWRE